LVSLKALGNISDKEPMGRITFLFIFSILVLALACSKGNLNVNVRYNYYVYAGAANGTIQSFSMDPTTGILTPLPNIQGVPTPTEVKADPTGRYLFVTSTGSSTVSEFSIDATTGNLNPAQGSPFNFTASPYGIVFSPINKNLFFLSDSSPTAGLGILSVFLNQSSPPFVISVDPSNGPGPTDIFSMAVNPNGQYLYSANNGTGKVRTDRINGDGSLTWLSPEVSSSSNVSSVVVDPTGRFLYSFNNSANFNLHYIQSDGTLSVIQQSTPVTASFYGIIEPGGRFLYVTNNNSQIFLFSINSVTGFLTSIGTVNLQGSSTVKWMTLDPTGHFLYVTDGSTINHYLYCFVIDPNTGALYPLPNSPINVNVTLGLTGIATVKIQLPN
jgi:6-phosphogluconolactonase (cycloisomerase 2 family)